METTFIGGPLNGYVTDLPENTAFVDTDNKPPLRYARMAWALQAKDPLIKIPPQSFFVLSTLSEQDAGTLIVQHLNEQAPPG